MADRYPLVINPNANQIQEIPSGDTLDLTGNNIKGAGIITATKFVGPMEGTLTGNISGSSGGLSGTPDIIVGDITAATGTFSGNVSIAGTLTYEDVKNVDSVGLITARNGLAVTSGTATFSGAVDANQGIDVDGQTTLDNVNVSGVVTATRFIGDLDAPALDTNSNGVVVTGVATATSFSGPLTGNVTGNLSGDIVGTRTLGTGVTVTAAGVVSATTYYGSGANLTGIDATSLKDSGGNVKVQANSTGAVVTGVLTATTFSGSGANLTSLPAGQLTGTVADARISTLTASKLSGALPAISGANLTGLTFASQADVDTLTANIAILGFKVAVNGSLNKYNLVDQVIDEYTDASGIDAAASTNEAVAGSGAAKYYFGSNPTGGSTTYNQTYNYTGSDTTISVATGANISGTVKVWGAGGGQDSSPQNSSHYGGGGAFGSGTLSYTSGDGADLIISVGQGGIKGAKGGSAGNGGGYSAIFLGSKTHANVLMIAGGGGGGGDMAPRHGGTGGAFGATAGNGHSTGGGSGGQQGAGGAAGPAGSVPAVAGSALTGGAGGADEARTQSAGYNGGGIQGQEPGGYVGGGGGGGGYYGGGGGGGGSNGSGGGGGSSYYDTGSYWSGTPTSEAGSTYNAGGDDDANYTSGVGKGGYASGSGNAGGNGAIYLNISVSTPAPGDLTLQSTDTTASSAPTKADMVMLIENSSGTATLNTDIKGYISRDSGTTFTQGTLVDEGTWGTNKKVVAFHNLDISGQPSGTAMCYKITTHNQASGSKETYIHATSYGWS